MGELTQGIQELERAIECAYNEGQADRDTCLATLRKLRDAALVVAARRDLLMSPTNRALPVFTLHRCDDGSIAWILTRKIGEPLALGIGGKFDGELPVLTDEARELLGEKP